jgi:hypothetical protein
MRKLAASRLCWSTSGRKMSRSTCPVSEIASSQVVTMYRRAMSAGVTNEASEIFPQPYNAPTTLFCSTTQLMKVTGLSRFSGRLRVSGSSLSPIGQRQVGAKLGVSSQPAQQPPSKSLLQNSCTSGGFNTRLSRRPSPDQRTALRRCPRKCPRRFFRWWRGRIAPGPRSHHCRSLPRSSQKSCCREHRTRRR